MGGFYAALVPAQPAASRNHTVQRVKCETTGADLKGGSS
jgi:hypothetical protein